MNALNEVNKLIMNLNTIQRSGSTRSDEPESLTGEKLIVNIIRRSSRVRLFFPILSNGLERIKY